MRLIDGYNLLVEDGVSDNHRYFSEVYKLFGFRDDQTLKEYFDFILHEPLHWMRGFPSKLLTKTSFSKPKTAVIKFLKKDSVANTLGREYVEKVHDCVWNCYKKHHEQLISDRQKKMPISDMFDAESFDSLPLPVPVPKVIKSSVSTISNIEYEAPAMTVEEDEYIIGHNDKIGLLKQVIEKLLETQHPSVAAAFKLLIENI
jgi:hypothetical protein